MDKTFVNAALRILPPRRVEYRGQLLWRCDAGNRLAGGVEHDGIEKAIFALYCNHAMRNTAVIIDAVAFMQNLGMLTHLHL